MSKFSEILNKVALLLKGEEQIEKFINVQDSDGTIYFIPGEVFEPGAEIMVVNEDGSTTPAPDGTYKIEESTVVIKDSKIESIEGDEITEDETEEEMVEEEKKEETEEEKTEEKTEEPEKEEKKEEDSMAVLSRRVEVLEQAVSQLLEAITEQNAQFETSLSRIDVLEKSPASGSSTKSEKFNTVSPNKLKWISQLNNK